MPVQYKWVPSASEAQPAFDNNDVDVHVLLGSDVDAPIDDEHKERRTSKGTVIINLLMSVHSSAVYLWCIIWNSFVMS